MSGSPPKLSSLARSSMLFPTSNTTPSAPPSRSEPFQARAPMSVLEWRRAVWVELQNLQQAAVARRSSADELQCPNEHKRPSTYHEAVSASESEEELAGCRYNSRRTDTQRRPSGPLIDLSQPRDADGRPLYTDDSRGRASRKTSGGGGGNGSGRDLERRHREAMRRLQAEATDQLELAQLEARERRRRAQQLAATPSPSPRATAPLGRLSALARRSVPNFAHWVPPGHSPTPSTSSAAGIVFVDHAYAHVGPQDGALNDGRVEEERRGKKLTRLLRNKLAKIRRPTLSRTARQDSDDSIHKSYIELGFPSPQGDER